MRKPFISIVIPTLNSRKKISRALQSIADQSFHDIEVVISDGASSDGTVVFASNFLAAHGITFKIVISPGSSVYGALNLACSIASGEWLYVLGSDDRLYSADALYYVAKTLANTKADVVYGSAWFETDGGFRYGKRFTLQDLTEQNICHQAIFYKSRTLHKLGIRYDEKYSLLADWDYNLNLLSKCKFEYIPLTIAYFSCEGKSTCNQDHAFQEDLEENIIKYFGLRAFYMLDYATLKRGLSRRSSPGYQALLAANKLLYPLLGGKKAEAVNSRFVQLQSRLRNTIFRISRNNRIDRS